MTKKNDGDKDVKEYWEVDVGVGTLILPISLSLYNHLAKEGKYEKEYGQFLREGNYIKIEHAVLRLSKVE